MLCRGTKCLLESAAPQRSRSRTTRTQTQRDRDRDRERDNIAQARTGGHGRCREETFLRLLARARRSSPAKPGEHLCSERERCGGRARALMQTCRRVDVRELVFA
eukprot:373678-Rhodomonas_salina.1